jgi:hypothetical protein
LTHKVERGVWGRMKWFFALNEGSPSFWEYANLIQVAVVTAREKAGLEPVCIYDGRPNRLTAWLEKAGVTLVGRRTWMLGLAPDLAPLARGAYLRLEIPSVCRERGWSDPFVLYTDCDVMFLRPLEPLLSGLCPAFFAAAPEHDPADWSRFNSGVLWIRVAGLEAEMEGLRATAAAHLAEATSSPYDQAVLQRHFQGRVDRLPVELNWKPYWGENARAAVLHFHGPKPAHRYFILNRRAPGMLQALGTGAYLTYSRIWDDVLERALDRQPWPEEASQRVEPGFSGWDGLQGFGVEEPGVPQLGLPNYRWGCGPRSEVTFTLEPGFRAILECEFQCPWPGQVLHFELNGADLAHEAVRRVNDPQCLRMELAARPGRNVLGVTYDCSFPQTNGDPRLLAVLFRALHIRREAG